MDNLVFIVVLLAAACHAGWNALIKGTLEPLAATILISVGAAVVSLAALAFVGLPAFAATPWLLASVVVHLFYFAALAESYRVGDLGQVYPIARGSAPLMTATVATIFVGETLSTAGWIGIATLVSGVVLLSARGGQELSGLNLRAVGFALFTGVTVCLYSIIDGVGGRAAGNAPGYTLVLFASIALVMLPYGLWRGGGAIVLVMRARWSLGLAGGAMQILSYGIAIWAMTRAPIAVVSALRETSVLFGTLIAVIVLKEQLRAARVLAALLIVGGLVLIRLA